MSAGGQEQFGNLDSVSVQSVAGARSGLRATIAEKAAEALGQLGLRRDEVDIECHMDSLTGQVIALVDVRLDLDALWRYAPQMETFVIKYLADTQGLRLSKLRLQRARVATLAVGPAGAATVKAPLDPQGGARVGPTGLQPADGLAEGAGVFVGQPLPRSLFQRYAEAFMAGKPLPWR